MPKGPKGEKRPADAVGAAVKVAKIATGEVEEDTDDGKYVSRVPANALHAAPDGQIPRTAERPSGGFAFVVKSID
jgi:hypothetical protein